MTITKLNRQILKNINLCSSIHKQHKTNILQTLIEQNKDLAPQGSQEWLTIRECSIGGSEMSIITGDNCFSKLDSLIAQKIGFSKFNGNIACRWGKIFEGVTQKITKHILDIDNIYETGSLEGAVKNQRYSPDGLGIVKFHCETKFGNEIIETEEYCIVLFEYKSPYSSIPMGVIPKHYLPQVKTGLCSIPIADFAIFINNLYRKCPMDDLNIGLNYDKEFHLRDKNFTPDIVLALGMNIFYQTPEQMKNFMDKYILESKIESSESDDTSSSDVSETSNCESDDAQSIFNQITNSVKISNPSYDMPAIYKYIEKIIKLNSIDVKSTDFKSTDFKSTRDFGKSYYGDFNNLLELYDQGLISVYYCEPHICESYYDNPFLNGQNKKPAVLTNLNTSIENYIKIIDEFPGKIGYLPWKLFKSDIIYEEREPNYVKKYEGEIEKTINIIKNINNSKTEFEKIKKFKKYFPKSKILKDNGLATSDAFEFMPRNIY
jgi:hypothetical protein